ncbi:MAG: MgtC/SapB family protein [Acidobacteriota bacterium]
MEPYEPHLAIATALAVGILVGLEREQKRPEHPSSMFGGVRTYPIVALIGALSALLEPVSTWLPLVALAGIVVLVAISYANDVKEHHDHGVTTEASVIATFLLGTLAASHDAMQPMQTRFLIVVALGVVMTFLLSSKQWLHGIASRVSREDFSATVKFLIVAAVVLPLLPRHAMGPWDAINPFDVGLMVVMISGLSFIGYVAMRLLGPGRGLLASAALGGLVSSTAVTMAFAGRAKANDALVPVAAGAIAIASMVMSVRVIVLVAIADPPLVAQVAIPAVGSALGAAIGALATYRKVDGAAAGDGVTVGNPFELGTAIRFGVIFAVILLATKAAQHYLGDQGLYLASAIGGTTDVDAVTLSTSKLAAGGVAGEVATFAIFIAVAMNTFVKSSLALGMGTRALGKRAFAIGGLIVAGAAAGLAIDYVVL